MEGSSPLCPPLPCKAIKLFCFTQTLSLSFNSAPVHRGLVFSTTSLVYSFKGNILGCTCQDKKRWSSGEFSQSQPSLMDLSEVLNWGKWNLINQKLPKGTWRLNPAVQKGQHSQAALDQQDRTPVSSSEAVANLVIYRFVSHHFLSHSLFSHSHCLGLIPPPDLLGEEKDWRLSQSPLVNDPINCVYETRPPLKHKRASLAVQC